jgi:hypothetical protein
MRQCIFCGSKTNINREHLWPEWVLKRVEPETIIGFIGHNKDLEFKREWKVRCVCKECNEGWMHKLEDANIPIMGPLIDGRSRLLDKVQQWSIAVWSVKTSMVLDSATAPAVSLFYTQEERYNLREFGLIPRGTLVWLGYFHAIHDVAAGASQIRTGLPDKVDFPTRISTFLLGSLVIQVTTSHLSPEYRDRTIVISSAERPWNYLIVPCWPTCDASVYWPPVMPLDLGGTTSDFSAFADRFNLGIDIPLPPKGSSG